LTGGFYFGAAVRFGSKWRQGGEGGDSPGLKSAPLGRARRSKLIKAQLPPNNGLLSERGIFALNCKNGVGGCEKQSLADSRCCSQFD